LDANLRNTRQIAEAFKPLVGQRMRLQGGDGPPVRFVPCSAEDALEAADDAVEDLLGDGWRAEDVALLTTGSRHPEQVERQALGAWVSNHGLSVCRAGDGRGCWENCVHGIGDGPGAAVCD